MRISSDRIWFKTSTLLVTSTFVLFGCSSGNEGTPPDDVVSVPLAGSTKDFCQELQNLVETDALNPVGAAEFPSATAAAQLQELARTAPKDTQGAVVTFADAVEGLSQIENGSTSGDAAAAAMAIMFDPEFTQAAEQLGEFSIQECGFDPPPRSWTPLSTAHLPPVTWPPKTHRRGPKTRRAPLARSPLMMLM